MSDAIRDGGADNRVDTEFRHESRHFSGAGRRLPLAPQQHLGGAPMRSAGPAEPGAVRCGKVRQLITLTIAECGEHCARRLFAICPAMGTDSRIGPTARSCRH
jgi:hypothetical protein